MTTTSSSLQFNVPGGFAQSTGTMTMFLKCDTASSGVGASSGQMPLFSPSYEKPEGNISLFLEAETQVGLWGHSLNDVWPSYSSENWSNFPSSSKAASGFSYSNLDMSISGQRIISTFAMMPMYARANATGTSTANMTLFTHNYEAATGGMTMVGKGHDLISLSTSLYAKGTHEAVSGTMTMVATGIGFTESSVPLFMQVNPFST